MKHLKSSLRRTLLLLIFSMSLLFPPQAAPQAPPVISTYSLGVSELDLHLWPAQVSLRLPLRFLEREIRIALEEAGRSSHDVPFGIKDSTFRFSDSSPILEYFLDIDGKVGVIPFQCRFLLNFALPAQGVSDKISQILILDPTCNVSGEIANGLQLNYLLETVIRIGVTTVLQRTASAPDKDFIELMKTDPALGDLLSRSRVQAKYCSSVRWVEALCFHISWPSMALMNYFNVLCSHAPEPKEPIDQATDFTASIRQFTDLAPLKPSLRIPDRRFPSKLHQDGYDGCRGDTCYDDGDATIFNGLLCIVGEIKGCETVRDSQDGTGRFWRSPDHINSQKKDASFTGDQLKGVIAYVIGTGDKVALKNFLTYVSSNRVAIPKTDNAFDFGYKSCSDDTNPEDPRTSLGACLLGASDWFWLDTLAKAHGLSELIPSDMRDVSNRFGYNSDLLPWQAAFVPFGFELHLIGIHILFAQIMGVADDKHEEAARILASRQPKNPFFLYLYLGRNQVVLQELGEKCLIRPDQKAFDQWAWERDQSKEEWKTSMLWDCAFMYRLLSLPSSKTINKAELDRHGETPNSHNSVLNLCWKQPPSSPIPVANRSIRNR